jgi:hypothetical protein
MNPGQAIPQPRRHTSVVPTPLAQLIATCESSPVSRQRAFKPLPGFIRRPLPRSTIWMLVGTSTCLPIPTFERDQFGHVALPQISERAGSGTRFRIHKVHTELGMRTRGLRSLPALRSPVATEPLRKRESVHRIESKIPQNNFLVPSKESSDKSVFANKELWATCYRLGSDPLSILTVVL